MQNVVSFIFNNLAFFKLAPMVIMLCTLHCEVKRIVTIEFVESTNLF
jgi:hypothetical protein